MKNNSKHLNTISKPVKPVKFIIKLHELLNEDISKGIIMWNMKGNIIKILDVHSLTNKLLPIMFKHSNLSNFIRQLNMYDFKKIRNKNQDKEDKDDNSSDRKSNKNGDDGDSIGYYNKYFLRDDHSKIHLIKRNNKLNLKNKKSMSNDNKSYSKGNHISNDINEREIIERLFILDWKSKELEDVKKDKYIEYNSILNKQNVLNGHIMRLEGLIYTMLDTFFDIRLESMKMIPTTISNINIENLAFQLRERMDLIEKNNKNEKSNIHKKENMENIDNISNLNLNITQSHSILKGVSFKSGNRNENENILRLSSDLSITNPFSSFRNILDKMKRKDETEEDYFK